MSGTAVSGLPSEPPSIWAALDQWAKNLAGWQQFVVGLAIRRGKRTDADIEEAYRQFSVAKELLVDDATEVKTADASGVSGRPAEVLAERLILTRVDELGGINALPAGATLTFAPTMTVIYGRS